MCSVTRRIYFNSESGYYNKKYYSNILQMNLFKLYLEVKQPIRFDKIINIIYIYFFFHFDKII